MNSFIKNNKQFFSLMLGVLLSSSLHAITFRNQPLSNFIRTDQVLCVTFPENSFVILEMENDNFDIKDGDINKLDNLKEVSEIVLFNRSDAGIISGRTCDISSKIFIDNAGYLIGRERLNIQAKISLDCVNTRLESPLISITGNTMNFKNCFLINPQVLNVIGGYPESGYEAIQVIFHDQPENPTVIDGKIDLKDNQTKKELLLSNVKEIKIQFNPQAWKLVN